MNNMTWLDLYNFLYSQANDTKNVGKINWQDSVVVHDANTGDEMNCDTWIVSDNRGNDRLVLATNVETIFTEEK
jgi:hypothetical protein